MKSLEQTVKKFLTERGWNTLRPADLAKSISIEAAELLELFQWSGDDLETVKRDKDKMAEIKKELADVFIYALDMAVLLDLDAEKIIRDKLALIRKKYPADMMRKTKSQEPGTEHAYLAIKKRYRRKGL